METTDEGESAVRYALAAVRNVGAAAMELLVQEREENGAFKDLFEFSERLDAQVMNKRQIENLARAGAFDAIVPNRRQVFKAVKMLTHHAMQSERESNQVNLFETDGDQARPPTDVDDWSTEERLHQEHDAIDFIYPHIPGILPTNPQSPRCGRLGGCAGRARVWMVMAGIVSCESS